MNEFIELSAKRLPIVNCCWKWGWILASLSLSSTHTLSLSPPAMLHLAAILNTRHFRCTVYLIQTISAANFTQLLLPVLALAIYGIDFELILRKFIDEFHFISFHCAPLEIALFSAAFLSRFSLSLSFFRSFKSSSSTNWNTIPNFAVLFVFHSTR